jgi:hypothetical protein
LEKARKSAGLEKNYRTKGKKSAGLQKNYRTKGKNVREFCFVVYQSAFFPFFAAKLQKSQARSTAKSLKHMRCKSPNVALQKSKARSFALQKPKTRCAAKA